MPSPTQYSNKGEGTIWRINTNSLFQNSETAKRLFNTLWKNLGPQQLVDLFQFLVHNRDLMHLDTTPDILVEDSGIATQLKQKLMAAGFQIEETEPER